MNAAALDGLPVVPVRQGINDSEAEAPARRTANPVSKKRHSPIGFGQWDSANGIALLAVEVASLNGTRQSS